MRWCVWWRTRSSTGDMSAWRCSPEMYSVELDALIAAGDIVQQSGPGAEYRVLPADRRP
jgi:hypothetical protein